MSMWDDISFDDTSTSTPAPEVSTGSSSWFNDYLGASGGAPAGLSLNANDFYGDLFESINLGFGSQIPAWISSDNDFSSFAKALEAPKTVDATTKLTADQGKSDGIIGRIGKFVEQNKSLSEMVGRGIQAAAQGQQAKANNKAQARSRMDELRETDRLKQADNARISASVSGLKTPGIVRRAQLTRTDGTPVFTNGKIGG